MKSLPAKIAAPHRFSPSPEPPTAPETAATLHAPPASQSCVSCIHEPQKTPPYPTPLRLQRSPILFAPGPIPQVCRPLSQEMEISHAPSNKVEDLHSRTCHLPRHRDLAVH